MGVKLNTSPENHEQFHAFEVYRDLGFGRSKSEVARQLHKSKQTVCRWALTYNWKGRLNQYNEIVAQRQADGALLNIDDPTLKKIVTIVEQVEALIDSAFDRDDATGKLCSRIKIKNADELTKLIAEERKMLETYHRFVAEFKPAKHEKDKGTHIKQFNQYIGNMSQADRTAILKGQPIGNEPSGNKQPEGGVQEADYTEVPERGNENGHGRDGVPGGVESGDGGDEMPVRES